MSWNGRAAVHDLNPVTNSGQTLNPASSAIHVKQLCTMHSSLITVRGDEDREGRTANVSSLLELKGLLVLPVEPQGRDATVGGLGRQNDLVTVDGRPVLRW